MATRTIYLFDDLGNKVAVGTYEPAPVSLTVGGSWTNTQYTGSAPDPTGLTFTCTFSDGTSSSVVPTSVSPSTWSSTVGTQTATFSYTSGGVTVNDSKSVSVEQGLRNPTSVVICRHQNIGIPDGQFHYVTEYPNGSDVGGGSGLPKAIKVYYDNSTTELYNVDGDKESTVLYARPYDVICPGTLQYIRQERVGEYIYWYYTYTENGITTPESKFWWFWDD